MVKFFSELKNIGNNDKNITFKITDIDLSIVNGLRRILISEIKNVAFDFDPRDVNEDIVFNKNETGLHNEFLGHRISLVPLHFTREEIKKYDKEDYKFILKKKNTTLNNVSLTTGDFQILNKEDREMDKEFTDRIFPKNHLTKDYILLNVLRPNIYNTDMGEEVDIECKASIGTAKKHARWSPVSLATFENVIDEKLAKEEFEKQSKGLTTEKKTEFEKKFNNLDKQRYFKKNIYNEPNEFLFKIESESYMTSKELFDMALETLTEKIENWLDNLNSIEIETDGKFYYAYFKEEDHTLGNLLQSLFYNINIRNKELRDYDLSYIGYNVPHPLDDVMMIKMKFSKIITEDRVENFLKINMEKIIQIIKDIRTEWNKF